jgi:predicted  nucleic acid-binding Zn-ribbon protein
MNIELFEKEMEKYKKAVANIEKDIAVSEDRLQTIINELKTDFDIETLKDGEKLLDVLMDEINELETLLSKQMEELNKKYGHLK